MLSSVLVLAQTQGKFACSSLVFSIIFFLPVLLPPDAPIFRVLRLQHGCGDGISSRHLLQWMGRQLTACELRVTPSFVVVLAGHHRTLRRTHASGRLGVRMKDHAPLKDGTLSVAAC